MARAQTSRLLLQIPQGSTGPRLRVREAAGGHTQSPFPRGASLVKEKNLRYDF